MTEARDWEFEDDVEPDDNEGCGCCFILILGALLTAALLLNLAERVFA